MSGWAYDWGRPADFGARVRAARGYAGLSQRELSAQLLKDFPAMPASVQNLKKLEANDPSCRGTVEHWAAPIATVTGVPRSFLENGWSDQ